MPRLSLRPPADDVGAEEEGGPTEDEDPAGGVQAEPPAEPMEPIRWCEERDGPRWWPPTGGGGTKELVKERRKGQQIEHIPSSKEQW